MLKLDERLALCASFVRKKSHIADIGSDHAYLPVYLAKKGYISSALACDIRHGPLENARKNIEKNHLSHIIKTLLSDGLDQVPKEQTDDIIIAGMGGELIVKIISRCEWLKNENKHLILQPMTKANVLRKFLCENGFCIIDEKACISAGKPYSAMLCCYDGISRTYNDEFLFIGTLGESTSTENKYYISAVSAKLKKKILGYAINSEEYLRTQKLIQKFDKMCMEDYL